MTTPKDAILEELEKGCGEIENIGRSPCSKENGYCDDCEIKISQHKISTDAEQKRILEIIDNCRTQWKPYIYPSIEAWIKELKQQITQSSKGEE